MGTDAGRGGRRTASGRVADERADGHTREGSGHARRSRGRRNLPRPNGSRLGGDVEPLSREALRGREGRREYEWLPRAPFGARLPVCIALAAVAALAAAAGVAAVERWAATLEPGTLALLGIDGTIGAVVVAGELTVLTASGVAVAGGAYALLRAGVGLLRLYARTT